jgi:hypothetical protein
MMEGGGRRTKFDSGHENYSMSPQDFVASPSHMHAKTVSTLAESAFSLSVRGLMRNASSENSHNRVRPRRSTVLAFKGK